jgi:transposase
VHLAHPLGNNWGNRRVKNDERDATDLVDLLRLGRLAEAWIATPPLRELREHIRYRAKLVHFRTSFKSQIHAVLAKEGVAVPMTDLFGVGGQRLLDEVHLGDAYRVRVESWLVSLSGFRPSPLAEVRAPRNYPSGAKCDQCS